MKGAFKGALVQRRSVATLDEVEEKAEVFRSDARQSIACCAPVAEDAEEGETADGSSGASGWSGLGGPAGAARACGARR